MIPTTGQSGEAMTIETKITRGGIRVGFGTDDTDFLFEPWATPISNVLLVGDPASGKTLMAQTLLLGHLLGGGRGVVIDPKGIYGGLARCCDSIRIDATSNEFCELGLGASINQVRPDRDSAPRLVVFTGFGYGYYRDVVALMEQAIGFGRQFLATDGGMLIVDEASRLLTDQDGRNQGSLSESALAEVSPKICHLVLTHGYEELQQPGERRFEMLDRLDTMFGSRVWMVRRGRAMQWPGGFTGGYDKARALMASPMGHRIWLAGGNAVQDWPPGFRKPVTEMETDFLCGLNCAVWMTTGSAGHIIGVDPGRSMQ